MALLDAEIDTVYSIRQRLDTRFRTPTPSTMATLDRAGLQSIAPAPRGRRTTGEYVAECLRTAIQSGALQDGMELNQVAIAEHFGVSRIPVREAVSALEAEGWITTRAHHRAVVQAISPERVEQIFEVRAMLEAHLVGKAVSLITQERLAELGALCDQMERISEHDRWVGANREFHRLLLDAAGQDFTCELIGQLSSQVERYLRLLGAGPMREAQAGEEHRAMLAAVAARDAATAMRLATEHIHHTRRLVLEALSARSRTTQADKET